jgi:hypothetical protein
MSARLMGTTIDSNLDITIKNKLYDVRTSLYTDYTEYIATIQQRVDSTKRILSKKEQNGSQYGWSLYWVDTHYRPVCG